MSRKGYFKIPENSPPPLRHTVERKVRFEEVDPMNIVWHGRYPSFFEDARVALGDIYGIGYKDLYRYGIAAPIKKMQVDYIKPLYFGDVFTIEAILYWTEAARMNFEFILRNSQNEVTTTGCTVQLFIQDKEFMMFQPDFFAELCENWQAGKLSQSRNFRA